MQRPNHFIMNTNHSQLGHSPSDSFIEHKTNQQSTIDQLLSVEIVTTNQSMIQFTTTNMIPSQIPTVRHIPQQENLSRRQIGRRRRRQRQRQRRIQQREEQRRQQSNERQSHYQQREEQRRQRSNERQSHYQQQEPRREPTIPWYDRFWDYDNWEYIGYPEYMEENNTPLLEAYEWEKMDPKSRWEQEQLNELEGFVVLEHLQRIQEEIEQSQQIRAIQTFQEEEEQQRNYEELIHLQQWEHIAFLIQQLNEH